MHFLSAQYPVDGCMQSVAPCLSDVNKKVKSPPGNLSNTLSTTTQNRYPKLCSLYELQPLDRMAQTSEDSSMPHDEKVDKARELLGLEAGTSTVLDSDDELLASLGYKAELKREFSYLTVFGQSFGAMGIAPAIAESIIFSLGSAGAPGMVWTYLVGCISLMPVALSLGELGSSMPTSGGLYYVSVSLFTKK